MCRTRFVLGGLCLALLPAFGVGWAQEAAPSREALDNAIQTLKDAANPDVSVKGDFKFKYTRAQNLLIRNPGSSLNLLAKLLDENETQTRLNGAITLARIAAAGHQDPKLVSALERCMGDSNRGIVYWGLMGLAADAASPKDRLAAIARCLDLAHPQILRMTAAAIAGKKDVKEALPWLVEHLKTILPLYEEQVDNLLTIKEFVTEEAATAGGTRPTTAPPSAAMRSYPRPSRPTGAGYMGGPAARPPTPMRPSRPTGRGRVSGAPGRAEIGGSGRTVERIVRRINPDEEWDTSEILAEKIREFEALPAVMELHQLGLVVEKLARKDLRDRPFTQEASFERNPPWKLKPCVEAAVAWMNKNRDKFPEGPKPKREPAPAEDAEDEKPGGEKTAEAQPETKP